MVKRHKGLIAKGYAMIRGSKDTKIVPLRDWHRRYNPVK
jgi:hypothetical protein